MADANDGIGEIVLLTEVVREQYVRYLERQLQENVCVWASASRNHHKPSAWACIGHSLQTLETHAIKASQAAQLYQRAMIKMISAVRRNTKEHRLSDVLFDYMQQQQKFAGTLSAEIESNHSCSTLVDKSTQTIKMQELDDYKDIENYTSYTLGQKIDLFENTLAKHESELQIKQEITETTNVKQLEMPDAEDTIALELAKIFDDGPNDLSAIFGIEIGDITTQDDQACAQMEPIALVASPVTPTPELQIQALPDLKQSHWPCELYAQRRRLSASLVRLLERDWRCENALRYKFDMLFGEDSDDEFSTQISSPSIDLVDEVLLASCILRIRPWIVRHLMRPLQEGLIANRFLFKKLAKTLANNIILINPYPTERQVKQSVEYIFCNLPRGVQSALDLESLPPVFVERFES